jgi:hypothetical protein
LQLKQVLVVAISLVAFVIPNVIGLGVWVLGDGLPTLLHSLTAILSWVVSFGVSSLLFWKLVQGAIGNRVA